jgi:hypothetical protein
MRRHNLFASRGRFGTHWLNREEDKHFEQSVENLKDVITGQASILAFGNLYSPLAPLQEVMTMRRYPAPHSGQTISDFHMGRTCAPTRAYSSQKTCHSQTDAPARPAPPSTASVVRRSRRDASRSLPEDRAAAGLFNRAKTWWHQSLDASGAVAGGAQRAFPCK